MLQSCDRSLHPTIDRTIGRRVPRLIVRSVAGCDECSYDRPHAGCQDCSYDRSQDALLPRLIVPSVHVRIMKEEHIVRRMLDVNVPGKRIIGWPNLRWKDACKGDVTEVGLKEDNTTNRAAWRNKIISRLYSSIFRAEYGAPSGDKLQSVLEAKVASYNESCGSTCAAVQLDAEGRVIVAICSPLMKRVHSMWPFSADMLFIDSSGGMDRQNYRVFLLLTHSPAGALPLGVPAIRSAGNQRCRTQAI